ncbi:uncharacterized protein BDW43DRAFT_269363 [Aspergillus alliaceus]|uniref:uncharacterized protein n=1 Tax=Petromyces alliaceus TaxID=209559 RepID=UPI0012A5283D|nr:uncharacterized protein BDW43DRAFT_269363 [Aspergillus alliaceus]KAB8235652.1 hypothetical protein BDW43DRAFT_269363 [Aspergillus alliaceus]
MGSAQNSKPITELALFHLKPSIDRATIRSELLAAAKAQTEYSKYPVYLFSQIEDPSYIYLLGGWRSIATHLEDWIPNPINQGLMKSLKEKLELVYMMHIDIDPADLRSNGELDQSSTHATATGSESPTNSDANEGIPVNVPVIAIGRYFLTAGQKEAFLNKFQETKGHLKAYIAPRTLRGGVRVAPKDKAGDGIEKEEFVLFSGWGEVQDHLQFAESERSKEFGKIKDFLEGADIKHASTWKE